MQDHGKAGPQQARQGCGVRYIVVSKGKASSSMRPAGRQQGLPNMTTPPSLAARSLQAGHKAWNATLPRS